jgi:hypothetical protein
MRFDLDHTSTAVDALCMSIGCLFFGGAYVYTLHGEVRQALLCLSVSGISWGVHGLKESLMERLGNWIERKSGGKTR